MQGHILRVGLVGCGEVCEHKHMPALERVPGIKVEAVADTNPLRARHVAERYGVARALGSVRELLESGVVDVVGVLTPPGQHREVAVSALEAGCHVLVEKPVALALDDADALVRAARESTGHAVMGFHMRWHRLIRRLRAFLNTGELGAIESIQTIWNSPRPDEGIPAWKCRRTEGGGSLVELGVHLFDFWRHLLETEVVEVFARARHGLRDDESASVSALLANGVLASAQLSERSGHELQVEVCGSEGRVRVSGVRFDGFERYGQRETAGMIRPRLRRLRSFAADLPRGLLEMRRLGDYGQSYVAEWCHVRDVVQGTEKVACTMEDGREALRIAAAATVAAESVESVRLEDGPRTLAPAGRRS